MTQDSKNNLLNKISNIALTAISNFSSILRQLDKVTIFCVLLIVTFGFVALLSASPAIASRIGIGKYQLVIKQMVLISISITLMFAFALSNQEKLMLYSNVFVVIALVALVIVPIVGIDIKGAKRWLGFGSFSLQPSELLKPFFIIINAKILTNKKYKYRYQLLKSLFLVAVIGALLLVEPDFGMTLLYIFTCAFQMFIAGTRLNFMYRIGIISCLLFTCVAIALPHVKARILSFSGKEDVGYQVKKALQSLKEGGLLGKGPGNGSVKYQLPDAHTDFIFSVICEEFGYIIASILLLLFMFIIIRNMALILNITDSMRNILIVYGGMFIILMQVFVNVGVNLHILPNKGMTLPLISYGGSAMMATGIIIGIVLCLTKDIYKVRSPYKFINSPF